MQISLVDLNVNSFDFYFELVKSSQVNSISCYSSSEHLASMTKKKSGVSCYCFNLLQSLSHSFNFLLDYSPPCLSVFHFYVVLGFESQNFHINYVNFKLFYTSTNCPYDCPLLLKYLFLPF